MTLYEFLSGLELTLSDNIDENYFKLKDNGKYGVTPLFMHNVARDVMNDIKAIILSTDDPKYVVHSTKKGEGYDNIDSWAKHEHDAAWSVKYAKQIKAEADLWKKYQKEHLDEFNQNAPTVATGDIPTTRFFSAYHPDFAGMSNSELMSMYKEAYELNKKYGEELKNELPLRPGNLNSKDEFKAIHQQIRKANAEKVGLPEDTWVCPKIHVNDKASIIRSNSKAFKDIQNASGDMFADYIKGLVAHVTSSTPEKYQKEWEELYTNIEDLCDGLTRGGRGTKLNIQKSNAKNAMNITIFTADKPNEDRRKLANISKVEPGDAFYTFTLFITSGGKRPKRQIATKSELRRTFEDLIEVLIANDLEEYVDCVENALDSICN